MSDAVTDNNVATFVASEFRPIGWRTGFWRCSCGKHVIDRRAHARLHLEGANR